MGNNVTNPVINEDDSTRVFSNTISSSYEEKMLNNQLHTFDSSHDEIISHPCHHLLECLIEDEPESDNNHVVDLSSPELVYITQELSITNDIITCSNVQGVIQVNDDDNTNDKVSIILYMDTPTHYLFIQQY